MSKNNSNRSTARRLLTAVGIGGAGAAAVAAGANPVLAAMATSAANKTADILTGGKGPSVDADEIRRRVKTEEGAHWGQVLKDALIEAAGQARGEYASPGEHLAAVVEGQDRISDEALLVAIVEKLFEKTGPTDDPGEMLARVIEAGPRFDIRGDGTTINYYDFRGATNPQAGSPVAGAPPDTGGPIVSLSKLPSTGPGLFGRGGELEILDAAWAGGKTNVVVLVAWGGVGKSALVNRWLDGMGADDYRGAERVFGWSFYSQGTREDRQPSADEFFAEALKFFGHDGETPQSPWAKGEALAALVKRRRSLLILDGMEPMQNPPGIDGGRIRDPALQTLVKELAHSNGGLCVISTRTAPADIAGVGEPARVTIALDRLPADAGVELLKSLGVDGREGDLREAVEAVGGHALALTLMGNYVAAVLDRDIRRRDTIPALTADQNVGEHAKHVMGWYERHYAGRAELGVLRLMGLFDRPAGAGAIAALRADPPIAGLTDALAGRSDADWRFALANLRKAGLLAARDDAEPDRLDCHPLVREHFGERLRTGHPEAWRQAHSRLYEYYKALPEKEQPDTLEGLEPLYQAVSHGCLAGRHREVYTQVLWARIWRWNEYFSVHQLGAIGADLAALAGFFVKPWSLVADGLAESDKAVVANWAGFCLRALGRLGEAAEAMKTALAIRLAQEAWENAAIVAGNLSELELTMGGVAASIDFARRSVEYADKSGDAFQRMSKRTTLADALHQAGQIDEAAGLFEAAEQMQKQRQPKCPLLWSVGGFRYCDLLLGRGEHRAVLGRAKKLLEWLVPADPIFEIALDHLSYGRGESARAAAEGGKDFSAAAEHLNAAVDGLRAAGQLDYVTRGLLARAAMYRLRGDLDAAEGDLAEVDEIAGRSGMKLHMADYRLESARLALARKDKPAAREHLAAAEALVAETGYRRRAGEIEDLRKRL